MMNLNKLTDCYTLSNGVEIPVIGLGTWQIQNGAAAVQSVLDAIELGYRHIDTAQGYGNEESVGKAIKRSNVKREDIFVTSKLQNSYRGYDKTMEVFHESLKKLEMEYMDLFLIHWPNPVSYRENWEEMNSESWRAMEDLYKEGKIRAIGISNFLPHHIDALMKTATITPMVNQIKLCPGTPQTDTVQFCREKNMLLEAYSPLATGKVFEVKEIQELANRHGKSIAQICMRWSLQMGFLPLPKTTKTERMKENADIFDFFLTDEEIKILTHITGKCEGYTDPDTITW